MSEVVAGEHATLVDPTPPPAVDYNAPPSHRTGGAPSLEDGDPLAGLEEREAKPAEGAKGEETPAAKDAAAEKASEAGKALNERKNSLVDDVREERERRKEAERILKSWQPILEKLDGRPDLQQAVMTGQITVAKAEATKEREDRQELEEIASDMGYVKADGTTPDLERAERYRARHLKWANQSAGAAVQPLQQQSEQQRALARVEQAVQYAEQQGDADPAIVRRIMTEHARANPGQVLDDTTGNWIYDRAVAETVRAQKAGGKGASPQRRAAAEPPERVFVETEAPGGRHSGPQLTAQEKALGEQYGLTDKDWERAGAHVGRGRGYSNLE